jgi:murein tripeptide amidase MpaA
MTISKSNILLLSLAVLLSSILFTDNDFFRVNRAPLFLPVVIRCPLLLSDKSASLMQALADLDELDIWEFSKDTVDIYIKHANELRVVLEILQLDGEEKCTVKLNDVLKILDVHVHKRDNVEKDRFFDDYQSYENIISQLEEWVNEYPDFTTMTSIGNSVEGRSIPSLCITDNSVPSTTKKSIFWISGIHAREWAGPATALFLASSLLSASASGDPQVGEWLKRAEIYILPISNPDGYEYNKLTCRYVYSGIKGKGSFHARLWRKNRAVNPDGSYGVDLNRNFDEHWGQYGVSLRTSSNVYPGPHPFSEPETRALVDFIMSKENRIAGIDFHSYDLYKLTT